MRLLALLVVGLLFVGCSTYNTVTFEKDSFHPFADLTLEAGQSGSETGGGGEGATTGGGGAGKMSPGGSNILDGYAQFALIFQIGGETPSTTTTDATAEIPVGP